MNNREHPLIAAIKRTLADPGATVQLRWLPVLYIVFDTAQVP